MTSNTLKALRKKQKATIGAFCLLLFCVFLSASAVTTPTSTSSAASVWGIGRHGYTDRTPAKSSKKKKKKTRKETIESSDEPIEEERPTKKKKKGKRKRKSRAVSLENPPVEMDDDEAPILSTPVRSSSKKRKTKTRKKRNIEVASETRASLDKVPRKSKKTLKRKNESSLGESSPSVNESVAAIEEDKSSKKRRKVSKKGRRTIADSDQQSSATIPVIEDDSIAPDVAELSFSNAPAENRASRHDVDELQATQTKSLNETATSQEDFEKDLHPLENSSEPTDSPSQSDVVLNDDLMNSAKDATDEKLASADSSLATPAPEVFDASNLENETHSGNDATTLPDTEQTKVKDAKSNDADEIGIDKELDDQAESMIISYRISAEKENHPANSQDSQDLSETTAFDMEQQTADNSSIRSSVNDISDGGVDDGEDGNDNPDETGDLPAQENAEIDRRINELINENGEATDEVSLILASVVESEGKTSERVAAVEEGDATGKVEEEATAELVDSKTIAGDKSNEEVIVDDDDDDEKVESNSSLGTDDKFAVDDGEDFKGSANESLDVVSESLEGVESIMSIAEDNSSLHDQDTVEATKVASEESIEKDEGTIAEPKDDENADSEDENEQDEGAIAELKDEENADDDEEDGKDDEDDEDPGVTQMESQSSIDVEIETESALPVIAETDDTALSSADFQSTGSTHDTITIESIESCCDDPSDLTCSIVTWNLAEESPSEEEAAFLKQFRGNDIVLISGQECENIKPRRAEGRRSREYRRLMIKYLGSEYVPIALHMLGGIQFGLFCKRSILKDVELVSVADVTCGIGNVFHNKGAIAAFVTLQNKSRAQSLRLLFVTAHMAAHVKNTEARNADFWRIVSELEEQVPAQFLAPRAPEVECTGEYLLNSVDRIFFCGDLNYRIDLPREVVEHTVRKGRKKGKLDSDALHKLLRHDQLKAVMAEGLAFPGFAEGKISFDPTFKYDKGTQDFDTSPKQRIPAWTDRVLFKPKGTRVMAYDSVPLASHSDHRPVFASFRVSRTTSESKSKRRKRRR
jgi:hypothetical protein